MALLAAGFLAGLVSLLVPWWLHRRDYRSATPARVSSLLLMRAAEEPQADRKVLRYRWLLAARLLLLTLLALAFAQPVIENLAGPAVVSGQPARLVAVDVSASMAAAWPLARERAGELLEGRAALVAVGAGIELRLGLSESSAEQTAALAALEPTATRLSYEGLVARLAGLADTLAAPGEAVEIHLVSDFQASAAPARFNSLVEGASRPVFLHRVGGAARNLFIESFDADGLVVSATNAPASVLGVSVWLDDEEVLTQRLELGESGRARVALPPVPAARHDQRLRAQLRVSDALGLDDVAYHVVPAARQRIVALLGGNPGSLVYARAALAAAGQFEVVDTLHEAPVAVLVDAPDRAEEIEAYLRDGGAALIVGGEQSRRAGRLPGFGSLRAQSVRGQQQAFVALEDPAHPALRRFADWRDVVVFVRLLPEPAALAGAEVLLSLDDGSGLLLERESGRGRALVLLTALDPDWATLAAAPGFVGFVEDALAYLGQDLLPAAVRAGESFVLPARNVQIIAASGVRLLTLEQSLGRRAVRIDQPGHYELRAAAGSDAGRRYLAVNVAREESDLTPMPQAAFGRWRDAVAKTPATAGAGEQPSVAQSGLALAPWLLLALLLLLGLEPVLANGRWRRATS